MIQSLPSGSRQFVSNHLTTDIAQVWLLPVMLPRGVAIRERENAEVHRSHVERTHLRLCEQRCGEPLLEGHMNASAGRDVYDRISRLFDARQESHVNGGIRG